MVRPGLLRTEPHHFDEFIVENGSGSVGSRQRVVEVLGLMKFLPASVGAVFGEEG